MRGALYGLEALLALLVLVGILLIASSVGRGVGRHVGGVRAARPSWPRRPSRADRRWEAAKKSARWEAEISDLPEGGAIVYLTRTARLDGREEEIVHEKVGEVPLGPGYEQSLLDLRGEAVGLAAVRNSDRFVD
jgi:hypothetical protein